MTEEENPNKVTYEVQKKVGHLQKRWEAVSYDFEGIDGALSMKKLLIQDKEGVEFRIVKKTFVIEVVG